jgi:hypothetical protein
VFDTEIRSNIHLPIGVSPRYVPDPVLNSD